MALGCLALVSGLAAENSSLSDSNLETAETKVTPETSLSQNDLLRKQLSLDRETQKTLTESLVVSNAEAELFRRKYSELQLRMEALGVEAVSKDRAKLEQRLLKAVSDLQLMNKEKERLPRAVAEIDRDDATFRKEHAERRSRRRGWKWKRNCARRTSFWLRRDGASPNEEAAPDLMDGQVISVKEEWSLVVGNLGAKQGVKIGMPLRVVRAGKTIATLRVVDVREKISGAVVQELDSEKVKIKVGDRLQVDARQNVSLK